MDDKERLGIADTFVPYDELTNTLNLREKLLELRRDAEAREANKREAEEAEPFQDTTGIKVYPFEKTHITLKQRALNMLKKS